MKKLLTAACSALVAVGMITFMAGCDHDDDDNNGGGGGGGGTNAPASLNARTLTATTTASSDPSDVGDVNLLVFTATTVSNNGGPASPYTWTPSGDSGVIRVTETDMDGVVESTVNVSFTTPTSGTFTGSYTYTPVAGPVETGTFSGTFTLPNNT